MRWERPQQSGGESPEMGGGSTAPGKRWGHTCNAIKGGEFLYVFGGYGRDNCQTNQVHVFDTVKQAWTEPVVKGAPPIARDSHSCTAVGDNLFVFGGTDGMKPLNDLHILETSSHTWMSPSVRGEGPEAREGHSAALIGKRLFIFGGCGKSSNNSEEVYYNDLYVLNTETFVWKRAITSGTPPSARDSHSCLSWKNRIIVIGGEDGHDCYLSDVHILDADTLVWKELVTSGQLLPPRAGHSTVAFGKNLFVLGGFTDHQNLYDDLHMLDVDTGLWTKVTATGDGPSARFSVAGDNLDPVKSGVLVFIGGCNKHLEALDDMYYLYTELVKENGDEQTAEKLSLKKQLKLKCKEQHCVTPVHNKDLLKIGTHTVVCQPTPVAVRGQPCTQNFPSHESLTLQGKRTFQAKVTQGFPHGCTIETVIDGKPLRGILFSNSTSCLAAVTNSNGKRSSTEVGGVKLCSDQNGKSRMASILAKNKIDNGQTDCVHSINTAPTDVTSPEKGASGNPAAPLVSTLNMEDDKKNDVPKSSAEVSEDKASTTLRDVASLPLSLDDRTPVANEDSLTKSF